MFNTDPISKLGKKLEKNTVNTELQKVADKLDEQIEENKESLSEVYELRAKLDFIASTLEIRTDNYKNMKTKLQELL
jgi:uncharacterized coiled-coil DUF342 family protein